MQEVKNLKRIIISLLVVMVAFGGFFIYKLYFESSILDNNQSNNKNNVVINENDLEEENNKSNVPNIDNETVTQIWKKAAEMNDTEYLKIANNGNEYKVSINKDGKVYIDSNELKLDEVVEYATYNTAQDKIIILSSNNNVYEYKLENYTNKDYTVSKIASEISLIVRFDYKGYHAGGCNGLLGLTKNNQYIELDKFCV